MRVGRSQRARKAVILQRDLPLSTLSDADRQVLESRALLPLLDHLPSAHLPPLARNPSDSPPSP